MTNFEELKHFAKETLETLADKSIEIYKVAEEKTKAIARTTVLTTEIAVEKSNVRKLYREIGQLYCEKYGTQPEAPFAEKCAAVAAALERIAAKQQEIDELKYDEADSCDAEIVVEEDAKPTAASTEPLADMPDDDEADDDALDGGQPLDS